MGCFSRFCSVHSQVQVTDHQNPGPGAQVTGHRSLCGRVDIDPGTKVQNRGANGPPSSSGWTSPWTSSPPGPLLCATWVLLVVWFQDCSPTCWQQVGLRPVRETPASLQTRLHPTSPLRRSWRRTTMGAAPTLGCTNTSTLTLETCTVSPAAGPVLLTRSWVSYLVSNYLCSYTYVTIRVEPPLWRHLAAQRQHHLLLLSLVGTFPPG